MNNREEHAAPTKKQWALLCEMRPKFCCLNLQSDYGYVWDVRVCESHGEKSWKTISGPYSHEAIGDAIEAAYRNWVESGRPYYDFRSDKLVEELEG